MLLEIAIKTVSLTKRFGDLTAVDHISFEVRRGEIFGFLGPNGAGKTTTIRMLVGLTAPTEGTAIIDGYDIRSEILEVKKRVGVVPEASNLYDELSVEDNLLFMAGLYHVPRLKREERVRELLKSFNLWDRKDTKFGKLSKGLKRRLTIAASLVHYPRIIFLDEPTTGLDVMSARSLRLLLKDLRETGVTIFLTTHYIEEADQLCDRIAVIVKGRIVTIDTPENMKSMVQDIPVIEALFDSPINKSMIKDFGILEEAWIEGNRIRIFAGEVTEVLEALINFATTYKLKIVGVNTVKPGLEEAFVKLTGLKPEI
ncbi:ATP-binding cassette domain-containing protein, partial [Candidatus Bathyarchaeota archaeon]|nr:ATP-binding cassette domain-containing protein [Candidatus Bathyarchaeota archaeon]